jgi:hypothetical protein
MPRARSLPTLRQIVSIRQAQAMAAEARVTRAAARRRDLESRRQACLADAEHAQAHWSRALEGSPFNLPLATSWSAAIHTSRGQLQDVDRRIDQAGREAEQLGQAWQVARERAELAQDQAHAALKAVRRIEAEAALADVSELFAQRRWGAR